MTIRDFQGTDPQDYVGEGAIVAKITYTSATQTIGTIPARSVVTQTIVARVTEWDAITTFHVGKNGDTDWLCDTATANVTGAAGGGEVVDNGAFVTADTPVIVTLNQGVASQGEGYVIVKYLEAAR